MLGGCPLSGHGPHQSGGRGEVGVAQRCTALSHLSPPWDHPLKVVLLEQHQRSVLDPRRLLCLQDPRCRCVERALAEMPGCQGAGRAKEGGGRGGVCWHGALRGSEEFGQGARHWLDGKLQASRTLACFALLISESSWSKTCRPAPPRTMEPLSAPSSRPLLPQHTRTHVTRHDVPPHRTAASEEQDSWRMAYDQPLWRHWPKLLVWAAFEGFNIATAVLAQAPGGLGDQVPDVLCTDSEPDCTQSGKGGWRFQPEGGPCKGQRGGGSHGGVWNPSGQAQRRAAPEPTPWGPCLGRCRTCAHPYDLTLRPCARIPNPRRQRTQPGSS